MSSRILLSLKGTGVSALKVVKILVVVKATTEISTPIIDRILVALKAIIRK